MINPNIFKAYDIRGIYGQDLDVEAAYQIGQAYITFRQTDKNYPQDRKLNIGIGMDMRLSSIELKEKLIEGLTSAGANVVDFGLISSPAFYFSVAKYELDGGIMVSASHNPGEWNGFKIVREHAIPVSGDTGLNTMRDFIAAGTLPTVTTKGEIKNISNIATEQLNHDLQYVDLTGIRELKVVVDTANGMGAQYILELAKHLPIMLIPLNFPFDGTFPAHESDPLKEENLRQLQAAVVEKKADLGIAIDGDGDRIFFVDDSGKTINPAIIRGLLAKIFLSDKPGAKIGYDVRPGKITRDLILENGGIPVLTRVGHSLIKAQMIEENLFFAGESSGHFYLNLPIGCFEMPNIIIVKLLNYFSKIDGKISDYIKQYERYSFSGEINSPVDDKATTFKMIEEKYSDAEISYLDGISVTYPDFWFNVRASNTENKMRLNLEAVTPEIMAEKRDEVLKIINHELLEK
jgi:phosphomannomutase